MRKNAKERERHYERVNVAARDAPPRVRLLRREEYIYKKRVRWRRERERAREQKHIKKKKEKKNARECILRRRVAADPPPASQTFLLKGKREMRRRRRRSIGSAPFYSSRARVKLYVLFFSQYRARKSVGQTVRKHKKNSYAFLQLFVSCLRLAPRLPPFPSSIDVVTGRVIVVIVVVVIVLDFVSVHARSSEKKKKRPTQRGRLAEKISCGYT